MISNNVVCAISKASDQPAHTRILIRAFASRMSISMIVKLLTEHHLEFLSLKAAAQAYLSLQKSKCHIVGNRIYHGSYVLCTLNVAYMSSTPCDSSTAAATSNLSGEMDPSKMSFDMIFPAMWYFDKCRLRRACAASF